MLKITARFNSWESDFYRNIILPVNFLTPHFLLLNGMNMLAHKASSFSQMLENTWNSAWEKYVCIIISDCDWISDNSELKKSSIIIFSHKMEENYSFWSIFFSQQGKRKNRTPRDNKFEEKLNLIMRNEYRRLMSFTKFSPLPIRSSKNWKISLESLKNI